MRFLAGQLGQLERSSRCEAELHAAQYAALQQRFDRLRSERRGDEATTTMTEELKREYFQALGVGMKLNMALQGQNPNLDLASLYDEARDTLPYTDWNRFLSLKLSLELQPKKRDSISAELTQLFRKNAQQH